ncbi:MHC class II transactivator [Aplochiton taeniatus]
MMQLVDVDMPPFQEAELEDLDLGLVGMDDFDVDIGPDFEMDFDMEPYFEIFQDQESFFELLKRSCDGDVDLTGKDSPFLSTLAEGTLDFTHIPSEVVMATALPEPEVPLKKNQTGRKRKLTVSAPSPSSGLQGVPHSPAGGTEARIVPSSPPGSMSDSASKALSPPSASPLSPNTESVMEYIQQAKAHMKKMYEEMEAGLCMSSHYVDVRLVQRQILIRSGKNANKCLDKELVAMGDAERQRGWMGRSQIFQNSAGAKPKQSVVLLGNAGMGKTTLIKKLCLDWSDGSLPQFDFVFLLDSRALTLTEPAYSLQTLLFSLSSGPPCLVDPEAAFNRVRSAPERVLLVFDGFDAPRDYEGLLQQSPDAVDERGRGHTVKQLYSAILQKKLLAGCSLLLSARPGSTVNQLLRRADGLLELCGFSALDLQEYLARCFPEAARRERAVGRLEGSRFLLGLCWNPGLCRMVCQLLERSGGSEVPLPESLTGVCRRVLRHQTEAARGAVAPPLTKHGSTGNTVADGHGTHTPVRRTGLFHSHCLRGSHRCGGGREGEKEEGRDGGRRGAQRDQQERSHSRGCDINDDHILSWANLFLQSFLAGAHLSLSRSVSDRHFLVQTLSNQSGSRRRRRPQGEGLDLAQRFAVSLLFLNKEELQELAANTDTVATETVAAKRALALAHLEALCHGDLSPAQLLELCHVVHEVGGSDRNEGARLVGQLARNLPEVLLFQGLPLCPPDALVLGKVLENELTRDKGTLLPGFTQRRVFHLGLEDTGVPLSGLRALVGLSNVTVFRACIADVIALWEELEQSGEEELLKEAVSKFTVNPLKVTQPCQLEQLAGLVNIHTQRRLTDSHVVSVLGEGVPAVSDLRHLELELGPEKGALALPKLLEALPALHNLQLLDLEGGLLGDRGAEGLAKALPSLSSLETLNLSQNSIGDRGLERLAPALGTLLSLHCLSLYSNVIGDSGAESLAAVLPSMASLTDLDIKFNKFTDVGAQCLGASLKRCPWVKSLGMWNQCIPYFVFERLQQQDHRIKSSL